MVINADLRPLLAELASLRPAHTTLLLADEADQLLLHPDTARCFHLLLGRGEGLAADLAASSDPGRWSVVRRTVRPERLPYALTLVIRRDLAPLLADLKAGRDRILGWAAGAAGLVALLWLVLARATALRLSRLTARVERHAVGEGGGDLPVHRRDEIGRLARSIGHMQGRIDQRVKELEEARAAAERSDRIRRELVANMSHEVRTPLNAIIGMAAGIDVAELSDGDRQRLAVVQRSAQRLRGLVDDLLLHARASEGRLVLDARPSDVRTVLLDLAQAHLPAAQAKGIALRCDVRSLPDRLRVDPLRLHQIADNLLGNAVRFTTQGQVDLAARLVDGRLMLEVSDTGAGIAPELQARVFERFERAAASEATDGAGLGLAITHRLVEAMGGRITLQSAVGQGSRFTVEVPVEVVTATEAAAPAQRTVGTAGLRVLYVEDVESNRLLMAQWAMTWGWSLVQAADAEAALAATARQDFDLVLIDQDLGQGVRGTELLFRLRGLKRFRYVPMLMVTAFVDLEHAAEAFKAGANDRITKPIDPAQLRSAAAFWTGRAHNGCTEAVQLEALAQHYDNDPEKVLRAFQQFRKEFAAVRLALQAAVEQGDATRLSEERHRIRPHWQLLGQVEGVRLLDALTVGDRAAWAAVEGVFRCCDRALMMAQRARLTGGPAA